MDRLRNVQRRYWLVGLSVLLILLLGAGVGLYAYSRSPGVRHANHMDDGFTALGVLGNMHGHNPNPSVLDASEVLNFAELIDLSYYLLIKMEQSGLIKVEMSYWLFTPEPVCVREQIASQMAFEMAMIELTDEPDQPLSEFLMLLLDPAFIDSAEPSIMEFC